MADEGTNHTEQITAQCPSRLLSIHHVQLPEDTRFGTVCIVHPPWDVPEVGRSRTDIWAQFVVEKENPRLGLTIVSAPDGTPLSLQAVVDQVPANLFVVFDTPEIKAHAVTLADCLASHPEISVLLVSQMPPCDNALRQSIAMWLKEREDRSNIMRRIRYGIHERQRPQTPVKDFHDTLKARKRMAHR